MHKNIRQAVLFLKMILQSALASHLSQSLCYKLMANKEFWTSGFWKIHVKLVVVEKVSI